MPIEAFKKIPTELINAFEENKDDNYKFFLDYSKDLKDQDLSKFTLHDLKQIKNLGRKSIDEINNKLNALGIILKEE